MIVERLRHLDTCAVSDAMDQLDLAGVVSGITALSAPVRLAGPVVTVKLAAGRPANGAPRHLGAAAIDSADPGSVVVVEHRSEIEAGCWGGILSYAAQRKGLAGVIAEGLVRDIDEARVFGFPIFVRGATARTARGRIHEESTNALVQIGGVIVEPGDFVLADATAVVFIPQHRVHEVVDAAEEIGARETGMMEELARGATVSKVMDARYEHMLAKRESR